MSLMMNGDGAATNGGDAATNGGDAATNGDDDAKTPAETLAAAQADYDALTDASTDEDRAAAMTELEAALKLEGNEAAYVAYLEKKIADQAQNGGGRGGQGSTRGQDCQSKGNFGCNP